MQEVEIELEFNDGTHIALTGSAVPLADADGSVRGAVGAFMDKTARKTLEAQQTLLIRELQHRTKNLLAVVQSVIANSLANDGTSLATRESIFGRLKTLAYAQDLVIGIGHSGVLLSKLIHAELGTFVGRFSLTGPDVSLEAGVAQDLALGLHELTTNAIKYGSLGSPVGTITIKVRWAMDVVLISPGASRVDLPCVHRNAQDLVRNSSSRLSRPIPGRPLVANLKAWKRASKFPSNLSGGQRVAFCLRNCARKLPSHRCRISPWLLLRTRC